MDRRPCSDASVENSMAKAKVYEQLVVGFKHCLTGPWCYIVCQQRRFPRGVGDTTAQPGLRGSTVNEPDVTLD